MDNGTWAVYYENAYTPLTPERVQRLLLATFDTEKEAKKFRSQFLASLWANHAVNLSYSQTLHGLTKPDVTVEMLP